MKFERLYTIIWEDTRLTVPPLDDGCEIMAFASKTEADDEATRQTKLYGERGSRAVSEPLEIVGEHA